MTPLEEANDCAYRGWPVVPLHWPEAPGKCSCRRPDCSSIGKHPLTRNGLKDASTNFGRIAEWWARWPEANYAICTGRTAGLTVLDVDGPEGEASLAELEITHGLLPATSTVATGRGRHIYWQWIDGSTNRARVMPGLDVRSCGGYVVGPGSVHASGAVYEWRGETRSAAQAPQWLAALVAPARTQLSPKPEPREWRRAISAYDMPASPEGSRNWSLYRFACWIVRRETASITGQLVREANLLRCSPPLGDDEVDRIINSAERRRCAG